ncbi:MAG: glycosyltransferase family 4 protein [bacterium]|nr:glycosyltransferase family 4 protein [bacterium]
MKILIATGIYPPHIGGPAHYAQELKNSFEKLGNTVRVATYGIERKIPVGLRHVVYFLRASFSLCGVECIIALDTLSTGVPAVWAARITGKKIIVRTGGDFLWESYVERTGEKIPLSEFYRLKRNLSLKEKIIFRLTKNLLHNANAIVFSTEWQRDIFAEGYGLDKQKTFIVENFYGKKIKNTIPAEKKFLWAGRTIILKNTDTLNAAFDKAKEKVADISLELLTNISHDALMERIRKCYALVVPSISDISPNLVLEGIMFGKPFILTQHTGLQKRLAGCGIFIDPLNALELAEQFVYLADQNHYNGYVEHITRFSYTHSYDEIARELLGIYKTI